MALSTLVSDLLLNWDILGSLTNHQTLMVEGDRLRIDTRYGQWLRRPLSGDGREPIKHAIDKTLLLCEELLHSYQCNMYVISPDTLCMQHEQKRIVSNIRDTLEHLLSRQARVLAGLQVLSTFERYAQDPEFKIQMARFQERVTRLCQWAETLRDLVDRRHASTAAKLESPINSERPEESLPTHGCPGSQEL